MSSTRLWIVDTNVVVAGVLSADPESPPAQILEAMLAARMRFVLSAELLGEYRSVFARPRIAARHGLDLVEIDQLLRRLAEHGVVREPPSTPHRSPDTGDQHLWSLLVSEPAAMLVTGDRMLLQNCPWPDRILTARDWVDQPPA